MLARYLALAALFPAALAVGYGEPVFPFLGAGVIVAAAGFALEKGLGGATSVGFREGYLVVALTWVAAAAFGALIYLLSGNAQLDRPVDAIFESMSGFSTTGATVLTDVEALDRSLLMWRQMTQWLGGMGIIVLALAVLPRLRVGGRQLFESEVPGPETDGFTERIRDTARRLWGLYLALTVLLFLLLTLVGYLGDGLMGPYEALAHAFTTLPTGGFSTEPRSVEEFSAAVQWVLIVFMVIAGLNFALLYRLVIRRDPRPIALDEEVRVYLAALALAATVLATELWSEGFASGERAIRQGAFQATSLMTTTGYSNVDFAIWPTLAVMTLVALMFVGGSAGSTSGSIKIVRHVLMGKSLRRELRQTVHPEEVIPIRLNKRGLDERTVRAATFFVLLYLGFFAAGAAIIAIDTAAQGPDLSPIDAIAASATTLGNVGPALGTAGPVGSFEEFSDVSSFTMIILMWLGRLEIIPVAVLATRRYWRT